MKGLFAHMRPVDDDQRRWSEERGSIRLCQRTQPGLIEPAVAAELASELAAVGSAALDWGGCCELMRSLEAEGVGPSLWLPAWSSASWIFLYPLVKKYFQ